MGDSPFLFFLFLVLFFFAIFRFSRLDIYVIISPDYSFFTPCLHYLWTAGRKRKQALQRCNLPGILLVS